MAELDTPNVLRIGRDPADLARLYPWLEHGLAASGLPDATRYAIHMALEEAVTNVAMHAFNPDEPTAISITLEEGPHALLLVVEDAGRSFDPSCARTLDDAGPPSVGGRGLLLLQHFCRDIAYRRVRGRNHLTLRFPRT